MVQRQDGGVPDLRDRLGLLISFTWSSPRRMVGWPTPLVFAVTVAAFVGGLVALIRGPTAVFEDMATWTASLGAIVITMFGGMFVLTGRSQIDADGITVQQPLWGGPPATRVRWEQVRSLQIAPGVRGIGEVRVSGRVATWRSHMAGLLSLGLGGPLLAVTVAVEQGLVPEGVPVEVDGESRLVLPTSRRSAERLQRALARRDAA